MNIKIITTTQARKNISQVINRVKYHGEVIAVGRRNSIDALIMQFPQEYNKSVNDVTNANAYSKSFDFLTSEPEIYSASDLKKAYAKR